MKGIVLAGGTGSRLWPVTRSVSKQLLPIYDKPMIYYPISTLMLAGIRDILIITTPQDNAQFKNLLGDGADFGVNFQYAIQKEPKGLAQAFIIGEEFLSQDACLMILGDNIFHGAGLGRDLIKGLPSSGAHIYTYKVAYPKQYGILELNETGSPVRVVEKPDKTFSNLAITGLYFVDSRATDFANLVKPSGRGELEITSVLEQYLNLGELSFTNLGRGTVWLDTGTVNSMQDAGTYIKVIEERTGVKVGCPEEIGFDNGWLTSTELRSKIKSIGNNAYSHYLQSLL
jgi:glucose-1-phosphate thymidylyltransferase